MRSKLMTESHEPLAYKTLPELFVAAKELDKINEEMFSEIRAVFIQFKEYENYGLILLHKHFDLDDEEVLVESKKENSAVSIPWRINSGHFQTKYSLKSSKIKYKKMIFYITQVWMEFTSNRVTRMCGNISI